MGLIELLVIIAKLVSNLVGVYLRKPSNREHIAELQASIKGLKEAHSNKATTPEDIDEKIKQLASTLSRIVSK